MLCSPLHQLSVLLVPRCPSSGPNPFLSAPNTYRHTLFLTFGDDILNIVQVLVGSFVVCVKRRSLNSTKVCHEVSQAFLVLLLAAFSNSSGACCLKNARGAGTCGFIRQEANDS